MSAIRVWTQEEDDIIIQAMNESSSVKAGIELATSLMENRTHDSTTQHFYDAAGKGKFDGKITSLLFRTMREKQKNKEINKGKDRVSKALKISDEITLLRETVVQKENESEEDYLKRLHLIQQGAELEDTTEERIILSTGIFLESTPSITFEGTLPLGGIPVKAKFKITGNFTIEILY